MISMYRGARELGARSGLRALVQLAAKISRRRGRALVLGYHRVSSENHYAGMCVSVKHFEGQIALLKRRAEVLPLREVIARLASPRPLDRDVAAITFDDGYRDNVAVAMPILLSLGVPATFFITTDYVDGRQSPIADRLSNAFGALWGQSSGTRGWRSLGDREIDRIIRSILRQPGHFGALRRLGAYLRRIEWHRAEAIVLEIERWAEDRGSFRRLMLNWDDVRDLRRNGFEIGSHSTTHPIFSRIPTERAREELEESKRRIEREIGALVEGFAFPNGRAEDLTARDVNLAREAGYRYACLTEPGPYRSGDDPFQIPRVGVGDYNPAILDLKLALGR